MKKIRGKKYIKAKKLVKDTSLQIEEAIALVKKASIASYKSTIEAKVNLNVDPKDSEQNVRFTTSIPYPFGKKKKILAFGDFKEAEFKTIEVIKADEKHAEDIFANKLAPKKDFDLVVCEAAFMPKIAKIAKILGPKGLMPNPKTNTVGNVDNILKALDGGQVEVRLQPSNKVVHLILGKIDTKDNELVENYKTFITEINKRKPSKVKKTFIESVFVKSSISPSVKVSL